MLLCWFHIDFVKVFTGFVYIPEFYLHGIHPVGGKIDQSIICNCGAAFGKLRKELEVHVAWEDDMWKPDSDSFIAAKQKIEEQVSSLRRKKSHPHFHVVS